MTRSALVIVLGALGSLAVGACDDGQLRRERNAPCGDLDRACVAIGRDDLGAEWPFSVEHGVLSCTDGAIIFAPPDARFGRHATGDETFALNREARDRGYSPPYAIWEWDGESPASDRRKSMQPVLALGRELCS